MFSGKLLFLAAIVGLAAAEVPSYIHVCGARNPNLDQCVIESVVALNDMLRKGIPELDIPSAEPLEIEEMVLADMPNFKAVGSKVKLSGLSYYHINSLHVDLKNQRIDIDVQFPENKLDALYNVSARILVPINGRGPITLTAKNANAKVRINFKLVEHGGKRHMYFPSMTTHLFIKDYTIKFEAENFDSTLQQAVRQALGSSHAEVLEATKPNVERAISRCCLDIANKICKHFTYDELFPDRE